MAGRIISSVCKRLEGMLKVVVLVKEYEAKTAPCSQSHHVMYYIHGTFQNVISFVRIYKEQTQ